jgi:hypothetical protein
VTLVIDAEAGASNRQTYATTGGVTGLHPYRPPAKPLQNLISTVIALVTLVSYTN